MRRYPPVFVLVFLFACHTPPAHEKATVSFTDGTTATATEPKPAEVTVHDEAGYSKTFVDNLKNNRDASRFELLDSLLIFDGRDTAYFPSLPPLGKSTTFAGREENLVVALTVTRKNYTTLSYRLETAEFGKTSSVESGMAHLAPDFYTTPRPEFVGGGKTCDCRIQIFNSAKRGNISVARVNQTCAGQRETVLPDLTEK